MWNCGRCDIFNMSYRWSVGQEDFLEHKGNVVGGTGKGDKGGKG